MIDLKKLMESNTKNVMQFYYNKKKFEKTFAEIYNDSAKLFLYFRERGLKRGDRIAGCGSNCYELIVLDIACTIGGFHFIPVHKSQLQKDLLGLIEEYEMKLFYIEEGLDNSGPLSYVAKLDEINNIIESKDYKPEEVELSDSFNSDDDFTTVFTSGTTGISKAFIIKFTSMEHFINLCFEKFQVRRDDKVILFLPLSQFSSRSYVYAAICNQLDFVLTTVERLVEALRIYKPTILQGVPFFYNKIYEAFISTIKSAPLKNLGFLLYKWVIRFVLPQQINTSLQRKLFKPILDFWGGRMRVLVTGAAPSRKEVLSFFNIVGSSIYEVYGLVETGLITMNYPGCVKIGSVGKIMPYLDYKFDENGQLFVKSDYCWAKKYINCSDEENKITFMEDGFIATGDIGYVDAENFLYLKGRKKDVLVLLNGNNIHPVSLENELNGSLIVKQSAVFGNGRPFLVAIIIRDNKSITRKMIDLEIKRANNLIKGKGEIKDFIVVDEPFSIDNKLMNENMKINRNNIYRQHQREIEALYL